MFPLDAFFSTRLRIILIAQKYVRDVHVHVHFCSLGTVLFPVPDVFRGNGFSWSRASKIGSRRPLGRSGSKDTESPDFVPLRPCFGVTGTLFPRRLQKRLLLPKGFQNRVPFPSESLYSRSYGQYKVPPLTATLQRLPALWHTC